MPEPPARIRSASVPCGVSSTSSSPERYCRANSLFSPTYDEIIRRSRFSISSRPRPHSSTPQLFETASRSVTPASSTASISTDGTPHSPNPPTASRAPSPMSATASAALATTLSMSTSAGDPATLREGRTPASSAARRVGHRPHRAAQQHVDRAPAQTRRLHAALGCGDRLPLTAVVPAEPVATGGGRDEDRLVAGRLLHEHHRPTAVRLARLGR